MRRKRWESGARGVGIAMLILIPLATAIAYQRIEVSGSEAHWAAGSQPVTYVLQASGSDDIADDSELLAIRRSFDTWSDPTDNTILFTEDTGADDSRTDYTATDIHLILFDEDNSTGYCSSGTLAVTPLLINTGSGAIVDADIIFNGEDHTWSTDGSPGTYDVQSIATHEIGHFLGLDHSGCIASTMYPYAESGKTNARSLTEDDLNGAASAYPASTEGSISGRVRRGGSTPMSGAHVVAVDATGVVVSSDLSDASGNFTITGLATGNYTVYAEPLDGPVSSSNITSDISGSVDTDFETTYYGGNPSPTTVAVVSGSDTDISTLSVGTDGGFNLSYTADMPYLGIRGTSLVMLVLGSNISSLDTVSFTGTGITIPSQTFVNLGSLTGFYLNVTVDPSAPVGPRVLHIDTSSGGFTVLTSVLEVLEETPTLTSLSPSSGVATGGTSVTLTGTHFRSGATVIFGDAEATGITVVNSTTITCTTPVHESGAVDVQIENSDGQIDVLSSGFTFLGQPSIGSVYPAQGSTSGGTTVSITGTDFESGLSVTFGGNAATVTSQDSTTITCTTPAGSAGTVDVVVTNPGSLADTESNAFTYTSDPDPVVASISPSTAGVGATITISGSNFVDGCTVSFGEDAGGSGGTASSSVTFQSSTELQCTVPSGSGTVSITVRNPSGNAHRLAGVFTYAVAGGGGGGGGCFAVVPITLGGPPGNGPHPGGWGTPYLILLIILVARRTRRAGRRVLATAHHPGC